MINFFIKILGLSLLVVLTSSCDSNKIFEEYIEVENANWKKENIASFEFNAKDTTTAHNLYINVRNTGTYSYSNLYLFVTMQGPSGGLLKDTVNCILADNRGKWLGSGVGDLWDLRIPYVGGFKFAQSGNYIVTLEQGMRVEAGLEGITDIGLRVEKVKE
jgi:gliding motility-associated lipoprotein GldH|tara:strand:- start:116 stop:595 length:480 start_codon:yes stop_codon:yes gene_type:complete